MLFILGVAYGWGEHCRIGFNTFEIPVDWTANSFALSIAIESFEVVGGTKPEMQEVMFTCYRASFRNRINALVLIVNV